MTALYSETQIIQRLDGLSTTRLRAYVRAEIVTPVQTERGPAFREIDLARLELLCELSDEFGLNEDALGVVMSLLDQLHRTRCELRELVAAVERKPEICREVTRTLLARKGAGDR